MICGQLTQGCLIEHVVREYFPVGIEATLCSFSPINYNQACILMYVSFYHEGAAPQHTTGNGPFVMSQRALIFHPPVSQSVTDPLVPNIRFFLLSYKHVEHFYLARIFK